MLYSYRVTCKKVVDGDTIEIPYMDFGFGRRQYPISNKPEDQLRFRLAGINAYGTTLREAKSEDEKRKGLEAKAWLASRIEGKPVRFRSIRGEGKEDTFGRFLVLLFEDGPDDEPLELDLSLNYNLLVREFAIVSKYPDGKMFAGFGFTRETT